MEYKEIDEVIKSTSYTSLLFGTYKESAVWTSFFEIVDDVFKGLFKSKLVQLVNVRVPDKSSREINILNASNFGFNIKNSFFTNEEYINLLENLKLYERKKGTKYFMDILGLIKNAHFNVYQLWTKDYKDFERDSQYVKDNSILRDYTRTFDVTLTTEDDGFITDRSTQIIDDGFIYNTSIDVVDDGIITAESLRTELPDINNPNYYIDKYYPTFHVDIDYDVTLFPISEDDIRYLFYKLAPIKLVLNLIDGVIYADSVYLYIAAAPCLERSWDTFPVWANLEAYLYIVALFHDVENYTTGKFFYNYTNEFIPSTLTELEFYDKTGDLVLHNQLFNGSTLPSFSCSRTTEAWSTEYTTGNYLNLVHFQPNVIRHITNEGLLLENNAINWVTNSNIPGNHKVSIPAGTYTLSSTGEVFGTNLVHIYSNHRDEYIPINEKYTFTTTGEMLDIDTDVGCLNVQLENTSYATSPILTTKIKSRSLDLYFTTNRVDSSKYYMKFFKHIDDNTAGHVLSIGSGFVDTMSLLINYVEGTGYILEVYSVYNQIRQTLLTVDYNLEEFGIILTPNNITIQLDGQEHSVDYQINSASQLRIGADWLQQKGFNGYLTHLIRANLQS